MPKKLRLSFILFSRESTVERTAIIVKIPIVTPSSDKIVLTGLAIKALKEKTKLSFNNLKNNLIN